MSCLQVACHNARRAVQNNDCPIGLFAGVNMMFISSTLDMYADAGLTSASGQAFVFDARADGFVRGEGCCTSVLRRVELDEEQCELIAGSAKPCGC